jgi:3',5'-nucleoside bisphosphate phosphatase
LNEEGTSMSSNPAAAPGQAAARGGDAGLRHFHADLHIHTALSPCGSDEMTPGAIVAAAAARGLDMIAVCDHNTAGNVRAVQEAAEAAGAGLAVIAGMELTSMEEVHVVGLFADAGAAERVADRVRANLPQADADYYSFFGEQPLLAADGRQVGSETVTLALATPLDLTEAVALIHSVGGLAVAAHVDRKSFSVFSQLGFFPADAGFDGLEVSRWLPAGSPRLADFTALGLPLLGASDSHYTEEIGAAYTDLYLVQPTFAELALALAGKGGRSAVWGGGASVGGANGAPADGTPTGHPGPGGRYA